jgi:hypothetical protein
VAVVVTEYRHDSRADVIVSRLLLTDTPDGKGRDSPLKLASLDTDQRPLNDISRPLAAWQGSRPSRASPTHSPWAPARWPWTACFSSPSTVKSVNGIVGRRELNRSIIDAV